ncbi:hypothetical protein CBS101457_002942 [Exobasidium rhododendri]|nr:hypothetical protein CBS101457_002942 [Exobasidium rhododendri]
MNQASSHAAPSTHVRIDPATEKLHDNFADATGQDTLNTSVDWMSQSRDSHASCSSNTHMQEVDNVPSLSPFFEPTMGNMMWDSMEASFAATLCDLLQSTASNDGNGQQEELYSPVSFAIKCGYSLLWTLSLLIDNSSSSSLILFRRPGGAAAAATATATSSTATTTRIRLIEHTSTTRPAQCATFLATTRPRSRQALQGNHDAARADDRRSGRMDERRGASTGGQHQIAKGDGSRLYAVLSLALPTQRAPSPTLLALTDPSKRVCLTPGAGDEPDRTGLHLA